MRKRASEEVKGAAAPPSAFFRRGDKSRTRLTVKFAEAPLYQQDNPAILDGYRPETPSWAYCIESWSWLHNETVNIHTHLSAAIVAATVLILGLFYVSKVWDPSELIQPIGRVGMFALATPIYPFPDGRQPTVSYFDTALFALFFMGACTCFTMSAIFHTGLCHSHKTAFQLKKLDFLGILANGSTNFLGTFAYLHWEDHVLRDFYIFLMLFACGVGVWFNVLTPKYLTHEYRRARTAIFVAVGCTAILPFAHAIWRHGAAEAGRRMSAGWIALEVCAYVLGAFIYAERCPETLRPGKFDIIGSSHQIMHVLAVIAITCQYAALAESFRYRHGELGGVGS